MLISRALGLAFGSVLLYTLLGAKIRRKRKHRTRAGGIALEPDAPAPQPWLRSFGSEEWKADVRNAVLSGLDWEFAETRFIHAGSEAVDVYVMHATGDVGFLFAFKRITGLSGQLAMRIEGTGYNPNVGLTEGLTYRRVSYWRHDLEDVISDLQRSVVLNSLDRDDEDS